MRCRSLCFLAALAAAPASGRAQEEPASQPASRSQEAIERIREARRSMEEDRRQPSNVQVQVFLANGERITGVVRSGRFAEVRQGREFIRAERNHPGAGIRIWYYNNTSSEIFLPYAQVRDYQVVRRLTDLELEEFRQQILAAEARQAAEAKAKALARLETIQARQRAEEQAGEEAAKAAAKDAAGEKEAQARAERAALLKEFPPDEGWGPERIREIERRKMAIGVFPSQKERRFLEVFPVWQAALKEAAPAAKEEAPAGRPAPAEEGAKVR